MATIDVARSPRQSLTTRCRRGPEHDADILVLQGVPLTDPRWGEARRGRRPPNLGKTYPAEPLTPVEICALIDACAPLSRPSGWRDRALLVLLWRTGLRIAELIALAPKDVDLARGSVRVLCGKGSKDRVVGIDPYAAQLIERWLAKRVHLGIPASRPLFCTVMRDDHIYGELHRPLGAAYVRNLLKRLARNAGLSKRVHPHGFRHTMTNEWMDEGQPLNLLQAQLGHAHLQSTEAYVRRIAAPELLREVRRRPWPAEADYLLGDPP